MEGGPRTPTQSVFIQGVQRCLGERSRAVSEKEVSESQEEKEREVLTVCWVQDPGGQPDVENRSGEDVEEVRRVTDKRP